MVLSTGGQRGCLGRKDLETLDAERSQPRVDGRGGKKVGASEAMIGKAIYI